ncbi:MAG: hypothetical protein NVS1B2_06840 [Vulcanimicrobiaceae bacterium]
MHRLLIAVTSVGSILATGACSGGSSGIIAPATLLSTPIAAVAATPTGATPQPSPATAACVLSGGPSTFVCRADGAGSLGQSGQSFRNVFELQNSNATGTPSIASTFGSKNIGPPVAGTVVASSQTVVTDVPSTLVAQGVSLQFTYMTRGVDANITPGQTYACTLFDGSTQLGRGFVTATGSLQDGVTSASVACTAGYGSAASSAPAIVLANGTFNASDTYAFVLSF